MLRTVLEEVETLLEMAIAQQKKRGDESRFIFGKLTIGSRPGEAVIPLHENSLPVGSCAMPVSEAIVYLQGQRDLLMFLITQPAKF